jgi:hypothetical protein
MTDESSESPVLSEEFNDDDSKKPADAAGSNASPSSASESFSESSNPDGSSADKPENQAPAPAKKKNQDDPTTAFLAAQAGGGQIGIMEGLIQFLTYIAAAITNPEKADFLRRAYWPDLEDKNPETVKKAEDKLEEDAKAVMESTNDEEDPAEIKEQFNGQEDEVRLDDLIGENANPEDQKALAQGSMAELLKMTKTETALRPDLLRAIAQDSQLHGRITDEIEKIKAADASADPAYIINLMWHRKRIVPTGETPVMTKADNLADLMEETGTNVQGKLDYNILLLMALPETEDQANASIDAQQVLRLNHSAFWHGAFRDDFTWPEGLSKDGFDDTKAAMHQTKTLFPDLQNNVSPAQKPGH